MVDLGIFNGSAANRARLQDRQSYSRSYPQPFLKNERHARNHPSRAFVSDGGVQAYGFSWFRANIEQQTVLERHLMQDFAINHLHLVR